MSIQEAQRPAVTAASRRPSAVSARGLVRAYGEGESRVKALDNVSLEVVRGQFTVVMGPSGSGKSTLMHVLAGLDRPDEGFVRIGDEELGSLDEKELTRLRRERIAFVFQSFNLLPVLTARENVELPLRIAGRMSECERVGRAAGRASVSPSAVITCRRSSPAASSSAWRSPGRWSPSRRSCSPTSRRGISTRPAAATCSRCCARSVERMGQTVVMVTHDPAAAAMGDRVVFLADGSVARDLDRPDEAEILDVMAEVTR